jgi:hypothetical protein
VVLNEEKYELICHEGKRSTEMKFFEELPFVDEFFTYYAVNKTIYSSPNIRDLGIIVNSQLNWKDHIAKLRMDSIKMSCWILNVFKARNKETMMLMLLFNSLVRSRFEYCSELWDPDTIQLINDIEQVQRRFTHKIDGLKDECYWNRLKILKILSLLERKNIIYVWKIKNSVVRNDIGLDFETNSRRSKLKAVLKPMPKFKGRILSTFEQSFSIRCAKLWNKLPLELMIDASYNSFIHNLDKWLELFPDEPPVQGYFHINSNSLLDYRV